MKQVIKKFSYLLLATALTSPLSLLAQKEDKDKDKEKDKKETEQIIITRKGNNDDKIVVEVIGDKVTVNGKDVKSLEKDGNITVRRTKMKDSWAFGENSVNGHIFDSDAFSNGINSYITTMDENRAMLGVTTEKTDKGAEVQDVTKESGAEKAGLKEGDIITKIDDKKIEGPDDLSAAIKDHKAGEKVSVTYWRDNKEQKASAELTKWKGFDAFALAAPGKNFNMNLDGLTSMPRIVQGYPRSRAGSFNQNWSWSGGGPKLGMSVQDAEDGKGVNVLDVDEDGNAAKAGIQEDDVITEVDGKAVNSADEIAKVMKDSKDKTSVKIKLQRKGKTETLDVKIPRKLKSADL